MAKITSLDPAGPITGEETVPMVQDGKMVQAPLEDAAAPTIAKAQAWAEGTLPGGAGTKSAKEWAEDAAASALDLVALQRSPQLKVFLNGETGAWLANGDATSLFTTNTGTANVAAEDDGIGMALDKRLMDGETAADYLTAQPELAVNGSFATDSDWTKGSGWTIGSGVATKTAGASNAISQVMGLVQGRFYRVQFTATISAGTLFIRMGATSPNLVVLTAGGTYSYILKCAGTDGRLYFHGDTALVATIDNVSVKEVEGSHYTAPSTTNRPYYKTGGWRGYNGTAHYLAGTAMCGASGNSLSVFATIPETISALQVIAGTQASTSTRFWLGVNTAGKLCAGVGSDGETVIVGRSDVRKQAGVAALVEDGTYVRLYWNGILEYAGLRNGAPSTSTVIYEGALNNNGAPASYFAGDIHDNVFVNRALTEAEVIELYEYGRDKLKQRAIRIFGDSTAVGAVSVYDWFMLLSTSYPQSRYYLHNAQGGETSTQMLARCAADPAFYREWLTIFMDRPNTDEDPATWIANMKAAVGYLKTDHWFVMPPVQDVPDTSISNIATVQATLLSDPFFAGHTFNAAEQAAYIAAMSDPATRGDGLHDSDAGAIVRKNAIKAWLDMRGW